jgi:hypothetical protein
VVSPDPTSVPSPEPEQPALPSPVEAVAEVFGAVGETIAEAVSVITNLGNDLSPEEKEQAREAVLPAIIVTQVAQAAVAMAMAARGNTPSGGSSTTRSRK